MLYHTKTQLNICISISIKKYVKDMYLATSQFDSRGEGTARVLTFRSVKAADVKEKEPSKIQIK